MALYTPDFKLEDARKVIHKLRTTEKITEEQELILYYINDIESRSKQMENKLETYYSFFNKLDDLLPNRGGHLG